MRSAVDSPEAGDTAIRKRGALSVTVVRVQRHLNSEDISYIHVEFGSGRTKELVNYEWQVEYRDHKRHETPEPAHKDPA